MEFRQINDDNFNMLNDEETYTWMMDHRKDEKMDTEAMYEFLCSVRPVMTIHFHNEENSWFLDVECTKNDLTCVFPKEVEYLQKRLQENHPGVAVPMAGQELSDTMDRRRLHMGFRRTRPYD